MATFIKERTGVGVEQSSAYGPVVRQLFTGPFDAGVNVLALKLPKGCIPRLAAVVVRAPSTGTCTIKLGSAKNIGLTTEFFSAGAIESVGKTLTAVKDTVHVFDLSESVVAAGEDDYITFTPNNAIPGGTEFDVQLFADYTLRYPVEE